MRSPSICAKRARVRHPERPAPRGAAREPVLFRHAERGDRVAPKEGLLTHGDRQGTLDDPGRFLTRPALPAVRTMSCSPTAMHPGGPGAARLGDLGHRPLGVDRWGVPVTALAAVAATRRRRRFAARVSGSRFDHTFASVHAGPRWLIDRYTEASLLANPRRRWAGTAPNYDDLGARLESAHRFTRRVTANASASWHERAYRTETHLDGPTMDVSLGGAWVVTPTVRAEAAAGWGRDRPETTRWRHERRWLRLGATTALPRGFTVGASGELRRADYEGNWFPHTAGEPREDRTYSLRTSVHNRAIAWKGFSPQLSLVHKVRDTNAQLYDYERTGGVLRFVRVF